jgi:hypothetical protein
MRDRTKPRGRMGQLLATALVLSTAPVLAVTATAHADAGNPILGTILGSIVADSSGTGVTVYVRGQWNWLSHTSDCNFDRAATGVGIVWNDPKSPGYTVTKGSVSAGVGVQSSTDGNAVDQMVHPVDLGNVPEGYTAGTWQSTTQGYTSNAAGDYPSGQKFADPSSNKPSDYLQWKGGCGREPLSATASMGTNKERTGKTCATGDTSCAGHPWGSWGYEKNNGLGYSHHYANRSDVSSVCANFYDVHGGGKFNSGKFQQPGSANEITVNSNGDNSIQTNAFNTGQGGNCVTFPNPPTIVTHASGPVTIGASISDTATISGLVNPDSSGTITFRAYAPKSDGTADTACGTLVFTSSPQTVSANGNYSSGSFTPSGTAPQIAGTYEWTAAYSGDSTNEAAKTGCGDANEQSVVNKHSSSVATGQKIVLTDYGQVAPTSGTGTPGGTLRFQLFTSSTCTSGTAVYDSGAVTLSSGLAHSAAVTLTTNGTFYWLLTYSGDGTFRSATSSCGAERISISGNAPGVTP